MKIYTRTGDEGMTGLFGGPRVRKDDPLIEAYGTVDELNSIVGLARAELADVLVGAEGAGSADLADAPVHADAPGLADLDAALKRIMNELFDVGADLATPLGAKANVARIDDTHIDVLEKDIDHFDELLEPLRQFILPGGTRTAAVLHMARTVCRRAERQTVHAADSQEINLQAAIYLNRLSDWFFAAARAANALLNRPDETWSPGVR